MENTIYSTLNKIQTALNRRADKTDIPHTSGVYKITNPVGEVYVGGTRDLNKRFGQYAGKSFKGQRKVLNSFAEHGKENHIFSIVEFCDESRLNERERFWSHELNANLNLIITGDSEHKAELCEETRRLISAGNKGKVISEKCRRLTSERFRGKKQSPEHIAKRKMCGERNPMFGKPHPMKGKHYPKSFGEMMSAKRKGHGLLGDNHNAKKVINTATGEIFGSIKEVCIKEGRNYSTIKAWLKGTNKNKTNYQYL